MKILIIGGDGMLGHQMLLSLRAEHQVCVTLKEEKISYSGNPHFNDDNAFFGINLMDDYSLLYTILDYKPDVIINASGVIKYRPKASDLIYSTQINTLLPQRLAYITKPLNIRLINFSTDCVFSGKKGQYLESDIPDPVDVYGQTKAAGEIKEESHCLTLRTSFFGLELKHYTGLVEWFLQSKGSISGYTKAIYSGLTTIEMTRVINMILKKFPMLHGLYHVSSQPIDKFQMLEKFKTKLGRNNISILPDDSFVIDRSLSATQFNQITGYSPPSWDEMLEELALAVKSRESI